MAQACEKAGFDTFWLAEAYPWWRKHSMEARSSTALTAIIARETKRITIGWGIISPYTRHPVQIAMEARVLQEAAGKGRFLLGLGASKIFMKYPAAADGSILAAQSLKRARAWLETFPLPTMCSSALASPSTLPALKTSPCSSDRTKSAAPQ